MERQACRFVRSAFAVVVALAALLLAAPCARAMSTEAAVREACLQTWFEGLTPQDARQTLGPEAMPDLLRLLADPAFPRRDNVVAFLTHLGGAESTPALLAFLAAPPAGVTSPEEDRALLLAPQALGHIAGRGDRGALAALVAMAKDGSGTEGAAARSPDPAGLRADLQQMAMRGLAFSGDAAARASLTRAAGKPAGADLAARALGRAAEQALELFDGNATAPPAAATTPAAPESPAASTDPSILDPSARAHDSAITWANHATHPNPMTDAQLGVVLGRASLLAGRADFTGDVACCTTVSPSGTAKVFGAAGDGLDVIDDSTELTQVLTNPAGRVKVVRAINYCGGAGVNIIGCGYVAGDGIAVVRYSTSPTVEGALWLHEYGHNVGLPHSTLGSSYVMSPMLSGSASGLTQTDCNAYQDPPTWSEVALTETGACTDGDTDSVQDSIDNCPLIANWSQADGNADGTGDACTCGGGACGCGNGTIEAGEECDDGNTADGDGCSSTCTVCGNGIVSGGEECDDGNHTSGDGCSAACTRDCPAAPAASCRTAAVSGITIKDPTVGSHLIDWKWTQGASTAVADFGKPRTTGGYVACLYSADGLKMTSRIPRGIAWRVTASGWLYKNLAGTPDGVTKILLQAGSAGRAKVQVQMKGPNVAVPALGSLAGPLTMQLRGGNACWTSDFAAPFKAQAPDRLIAKSPS